MSDYNPETCSCSYCVEWRNTVKSICIKTGLSYAKLTRNHKTTLFNLFVLTDTPHREHNWRIMKHQFDYAKERTQ